MRIYTDKNTFYSILAPSGPYTVRAGTRHWPVAVFYNMIDMAALNAHVLSVMHREAGETGGVPAGACKRVGSNPRG